MVLPYPLYLYLYYILYIYSVTLCLRTRVQKTINSNISFDKLKLFSNHQHDQLTFLGSKTRYISVYALTWFISLRVVDSMLPTTVKLAVILQLELRHFTFNEQTIQIKKSKAVKGHMLIFNQPVPFDDFKVLAFSNSEFHLKIKESLLISRDQPYLFDQLHKYFTFFITIQFHHSYIVIYLLLFLVTKYMLQ